MLGEYYFRLSDFNEEELDNEIDIIAIGHMGCCRALPDYNEILEVYNTCKKHNKKLRLYTPRVPQEHLKFMMEYLQAISRLFESDFFQLVINDIGLLLWMKEKNYKPKQLILGATYSWSAMQNSLYDNIIRDEKEDIKRMYAQVNNNNDIRLSFLKDLNITEIEVPNIKGVLEQVDRIRDNGFAISVFKTFILAGFSRSCVHCKIKKIKASDCNKECEEVFKLDMNQMWDYLTGSFPYFVDKPEINTYYSSLFVHGNMQYRELKNSIKGDEDQLNLMKDTIIKCSGLDKLEKDYEYENKMSGQFIKSS